VHGLGERQCPCDINCLELWPVITDAVVLAEVRRRVKHHVATVQCAGESRHVLHVADHQLGAQIAKELPRLDLGTHQRADVVPFGAQRPNEVVAEKPGRSGDEHSHRSPPLLSIFGSLLAGFGSLLAGFGSWLAVGPASVHPPPKAR
jgi:hypothetical protein